MPDVNILVYAIRRDDPAHAFYFPWLSALANGEEPFALSALVATGFLRVVTNPRMPGGGSTLEEASAFLERIATAPSCRLIGASAESWRRARDLCAGSGSRGPALSDAHHAAIAMEHDCTLVSRDTDYARWRSKGLRFELLEP